MNKFRFVVALAVFCCMYAPDLQAQQSRPLPQLGKSSLKDVIKAMTIEEKASLVVGTDAGFPRGYPSIFGGPDTLFGKVVSAVGYTPQIVPGSAGTTFGVPRLGIPAIVLADGPAGLRISPTREGTTKTFYATAFPVATLIASSWDTTLAYKVGKAMGNEVLEYGVDVLLAPALNIHRNPLGGRNFEYYSEDPLLSGHIAKGMVRGVQSNGVGTSIKHFAANNNETNRMFINAVVSERALREIYLKGFQIAAEAKPWTVMSSYNQINGTWASQNHDLLTKILRNEWGYKGFVMTDWFAGRDGVAQIKAGNDMIMPGSSQIVTQIVSAVKSGRLKESDLDKNVEAILGIVLQTPRFKKYSFSNNPDLKGHATVSRETATEGMVLLKNESSTLPLKGVKTIAAFGNASYQLISGGTGSGDVNKAYSISFIEGLANAGMQVDGKLKTEYDAFLKHAKDTLRKPASFMDRQPLISEMSPSKDLINSVAASADFAVITLSRNSGEFHDRLLEGDFSLSAHEKMMITNVSDAFHAKGKKVLVLLNVGGVIETASWRDKADAILLAWQPGQEAGNAIADVLVGKVNPSGKLATTFPVNFNDIPSSKNFPTSPGTPFEVKYEEGIFVGYRYFNTFNIKPAYSFGFGLSYTSFKYDNPKINTKNFDAKAVVSVTVKNTGTMAGKEVVQLYISAPGKDMEKPALELKGFSKTKLLQPGESQTLTFPVKAIDLASFNTKQGAWIAEAGTYALKIGASSSDIRSQLQLNVAKPILVQTVGNELKLTSELKELSKNGF